MKRVIKDKFVMSITIGPKGQIVIPKIARDMFNLQVGETVIMLGDKKKGIAIVKEQDFYKKAGM